ncbi:MAG TPA: PilN domain-containing protein [bacterium]|nr:PilN domain-containing protein [bacterium]
MKLTTNFAPPVGRMVWPATVAVWLLALFLVAAMLALAAQRAELRAQVPRLRARVAQLAQRRVQVGSPQLPPADELAALRHRVARINTLAETPGVAPLAVLQALETTLPDAVYLVSLRIDAVGGEVSLLAESGRSAALSDLLHRLEASKAFADVQLVQQQAVGTADRQRERAEVHLRLAKD